MKRIIYFILNNLTIWGFCTLLILTDRSFLFGQIVQMGGLPIPNTTSIQQTVYNSNSPQTPIRQIQYLAPTTTENDLVEPIPLATSSTNLATMSRRSNLVIPLPPATKTVASVSPQDSILGQYSLPQLLPSSSVSSSFLLASHPQETDQTPSIQFGTPVLPEATAVKPIPTVSTVPPATAVPAIAVPESTFPAVSNPSPSPSPTPLPPQPPHAVPATPTRLIASEAITKNHRLQRVNSETFEQKLVEKLGKRFVPIRNIETSTNLSRFRVPVKDGTDVELSIDRQNSIITIIGSAPMVTSCLQIVRLLDSPENAEFIPIQQSNRGMFHRTAQIINREAQKLAQNAPTSPRNNDQPSAAFVTPNTGTPNTPTQNNTIQNNIPITAGIVGPVQIDIIEGIDELVIQGQKNDVAIIREILRQIETMSLEHEPIIELIPMQHADSYRISQMVQQLYSQVYQARKGNITMLPLIKPNTI
ncbi:MAG: hypothetical protein LBI18_12625, partial [Planctomycetaceae bacterium]|nr:hypothetical protein [Planctomycetaceae bacterium]